MHWAAMSFPTPGNYLNHCNVDRIWEAWMQRLHPARPYRPDGVNDVVSGHNRNDPMVTLVGATMTPAQTLDLTGSYEYDDLMVEV